MSLSMPKRRAESRAAARRRRPGGGFMPTAWGSGRSPAWSGSRPRLSPRR